MRQIGDVIAEFCTGKLIMRRRTLKLIVLMMFLLLMLLTIVAVVRLNYHVPGVENAQNDEERVLSIARFIARKFDNRPHGSAYFGIFYSQRLPSVIRLPIGILETITHARDCDSMVRAFVYMTSREGIEARQTDIFAPTFVHSLAEVRLGDRWVVVDPYLGVIFRQSDGILADFKTIKKNYAELTQVGLRADDKIAASAKFYYSQLTSAITAQSGTEIAVPLVIQASQLPMTIGKLDSSNDDVISELIDGAMGPIGSFLGPKLGSRKQTRLILVGKPHDVNVEITFKLTDRTTTPPSVDSTPTGACVSKVGALHCRAMPGVAELIIRHGEWRRVFAVDQIHAKRTL